MTGWDGFAKYCGIQGVLALLTTAVAAYMVIRQFPVPSEFYTLLGAAWGFYFAKNGYSIAQIGQAIAKKAGEV